MTLKMRGREQKKKTLKNSIQTECKLLKDPIVKFRKDIKILVGDNRNFVFARILQLGLKPRLLQGRRKLPLTTQL